MNDVKKILAEALDKLKASNPLAFVALILFMIGSTIAIDHLPYFRGEMSEFWMAVKYVIYLVTGFSSTSTYQYLPEDHPKKQAVKQQTNTDQ